MEKGTQKLAENPASDPSEWLFACHGSVYEIAGSGERVLLNWMAGLGYIERLLRRPGEAETVLAARQAVLDAAHAAHPERFVHRPPRPLALPVEVWINPPADRPEPRMLQLPRDTNCKQQLSHTG